MTGNYYNRKVFQINTLSFRLTLISQQQWTSKKKNTDYEATKKRDKKDGNLWEIKAYSMSLATYKFSVI